MQAQQSLCHLEKIFLRKDLGTTQLVTTKGNVTIYDNSLMHGETSFFFFFCCKVLPGHVLQKSFHLMASNSHVTGMFVLVYLYFITYIFIVL